MIKIISANKTVVENLNYQRDNIGNITRITNSVNGKVTAYTYNARYQLSNVNSTVNSEDRSYTYDAVGNRKTMLENAITYYYNHSTGNRLTDVRTGLTTGPLYRQFTYDDAGRITAKSDGNGAIIYLLSYTDKGQVFASYTPLAGAKSYAYDANDYRINKNNTLYHLEGENLEATYSSTGVLENKYLRGVIVDEIVNGFTYHSSDQNDWTNYTFHHDHLNSVTAQTGHAGTTEETTNYDAFGSPSLTLPGTGNDLLYTGREYDQETSLYYYRARYYDAEIGRFISEDPLGFGAGVNFYAYVNNNPVNFNDPFGRDAVTLGLSVRVFGTGISLGGEVRFPGVSDEPFDIGINGAFTPGLAGETILGLIDPENPFANASTGLDLARLTLDVGFDTVPRSESSFAGVEVFAGAPAPFVGGIGGTATFDANQQGSFPTGGQINIGSQLRVGANLQLQGSLTVRDILGFGQDAVDFIGDQFSSNQVQSAGGGFVLYPNRPNTNIMRTVYAK